MISAWWLFLIIPLTFSIGYVTCGVMVTNTMVERCQNCKHNKKEAD